MRHKTSEVACIEAKIKAIEAMTEEEATTAYTCESKAEVIDMLACYLQRAQTAKPKPRRRQCALSYMDGEYWYRDNDGEKDAIPNDAAQERDSKL